MRSTPLLGNSTGAGAEAVEVLADDVAVEDGGAVVDDERGDLAQRVGPVISGLSGALVSTVTTSILSVSPFRAMAIFTLRP